MTDVTMNPRTNEGATAKENLQSNMLRQAQMQRYRKLQQRDAQLRQEAIERSRRLQDKYIVNTVYMIPGGGLSQKTESKSNKELGAYAEGEVKAPDDLMIGLSSGLSILHKGESIDFERTGNLLSNYENYIISEENRKIKEEISFLNAQRTAFHFNNMSSRFGSLPFYSEPKELTQAERDNLVLIAQDKSATVAERRAAMSALSGTLEGKYETSWIGERASAEAIQADSDKFVVRAQDKTATVEQRRAAMSILSETAMATEPYEGKYETIRSGQIAYEMSNAKIQERLNSDLYTDSISKVPKGKELDLSQEVFAKEKQITDRVFGDDWTSAGGKSETSYQNVKGTEKSDVADQYVLLTEGGKRYTLLTLGEGGYSIYDWHGDYVGGGPSFGENNKALKKSLLDLNIVFDEKVSNPLSPEASGRVILDDTTLLDKSGIFTPATLKSDVLDTFWTKSEIESFQNKKETPSNTIQTEFGEISIIQKTPDFIDVQKKSDDFSNIINEVNSKLQNELQVTNSEQESEKSEDSLQDYLKELKSQGTLWKVAKEKGFSDLSVSIIGGTEIIQQAGSNWLDEQQARVNKLVDLPFVANENKEIFYQGTEFTKHFVSFPLMFQSLALTIPAGEDVLRSKEVSSFVPFIEDSKKESWIEKAQVALPAAVISISDYASENPVAFLGDTAGIVVGPKSLKLTGLGIGRKTGIVRSKTYVAENPTGHPLGSQSAMLEAIIDQPTISGARGTIQTPKQFVNRFLNNEVQWTRSYSEAGGTFGEQAQYTTISPKFNGQIIQERVGSYFIQKGVKTPLDKVFRTRVHIIEDVETVASELSPAEKVRIWEHWEKFGEISQEDYKMLVSRAVAKSERINQPVVGPTPKLRKGSVKPELEAMLFFGTDFSKRITSSQFAGITEEGTIIRKVRFGNQQPIEKSSIIAENRAYNSKLKQHRIEAMSVDMNRKVAELSGKARTKPDQYSPHGSEHLDAVAEELDVLRAKSNIYRTSFTQEEGEVAAFLHDSAKIYGVESEPFEHATAAKLAIKKGLIKYDPLNSLPESSQIKVAEAIGQHTRIKPNVVSKIIHRPSEFDMALATADRLSWAKVTGKVKKGKIFPIPETTASHLAAIELKNFFRTRSPAIRKPVASAQYEPFNINTPDTSSKIDKSLPKTSTDRSKWPEQHSVITPKEDGEYIPIENMKTKPTRKPFSEPKTESSYLENVFSYKSPASIYKPVSSYKNPITNYGPKQSQYNPKSESYKEAVDNYKKLNSNYSPKQNKYNTNSKKYTSQSQKYSPKTNKYTQSKGNYKTQIGPYLPQIPKDIFEMPKSHKTKKPDKKKNSDLNLFNVENVEIPIVRGQEAMGGKYDLFERPSGKKTFLQMGGSLFRVPNNSKLNLRKKRSKRNIF